LFIEKWMEDAKLAVEKAMKETNEKEH